MGCSSPGFSVHGIFQARVLEWVAISFSRDLPNPGIEPGSPPLQADALPSDPPEKTVVGCNFKNDRMISVHFQGKPFSITVIQVYAPTTNAKEAEVEQFYEDLQDLLELKPKKEVLLII